MRRKAAGWGFTPPSPPSQTPHPQGAVVAEAAPHPEDPGQVQHRAGHLGEGAPGARQAEEDLPRIQHLRGHRGPCAAFPGWGGVLGVNSGWVRPGRVFRGLCEQSSASPSGGESEGCAPRAAL